MEKFTQFSDKSTGIGPFKTTYLKPTPLTVVFHFFLVVIKAATVLPVVLFGMLAWPFNSAYRVYLDIVLAYFFNVQDVDVSVEGVKRTDAAKIEQMRPTKSDLVFVNATSPLDTMVLQMVAHTPKHVSFAVVDNSGALRLVPAGHGAFADWCYNGSVVVPSNWTKIAVPSKLDTDEALETLRANLASAVGDNTLYVFPEGTITNNRGVLGFPQGFNENGSFADACKSLGRAVKTCTVKLMPMGNMGTVLPIGKVWWYYLNFGSMKMDTKVKIVISPLDEANITNEVIRTKLSNNGRLKLLSKTLTVASKVEYINAIREKKYL